MDKKHWEKIDNFNQSWKKLEDISKLAEQYEIHDIAQDNNLKLLQTLVLFDLENISSREGSDAKDRYGNLWELKTLNLNNKSKSGFTTNHHVNHSRIEAFRKERWLFSLYKGIELIEVYAVSPKDLEEKFSDWERQIEEKKGEDLNNPKIPVAFVKSHGIKVYPVSPPIDPAEVLKEI